MERFGLLFKLLTRSPRSLLPVPLVCLLLQKRGCKGGGVETNLSTILNI